MSTEEFPKQFHDVLGMGKTLLQMSFDRMLLVCPKENIYIVTNLDYKELVQEQLPGIDENQILRPSIETTLHALLPHKIVLHVHSVNAIAWTIRKDGFKQLKDKLQGLNWSWLDYHQPGLPLTNAVVKVIKKKSCVTRTWYGASLEYGVTAIESIE